MLKAILKSKLIMMHVLALCLGLSGVTPALAKKMTIKTPTDDIVLIQHKKNPNLICIGSDVCSNGFHINATKRAKNTLWWSGFGYGALTALSGSVLLLDFEFIRIFPRTRIFRTHPYTFGTILGISALVSGTLSTHLFNQTRQKISVQKALNKIIKFFKSDSKEDLVISSAGVFDLDRSGTVFLRDEDTRFHSIHLMVEVSRTLINLLDLLIELDR
ncbi:MAG: hypothetical protein HRU09_20840 [Oligoflexales bacterium]|nr:hypothetical protein [Oligoflexales bacterium]